MSIQTAVTLKRKSGMRKLSLFLIPAFFIITIFILFRTVFIIGYVPSASMEPTLKENSLVLGVRIFDDIKAGDIVIFEYDGKLLVKRVAAIGGETIEVNGVLYAVPESNYFMLGDNATNSYDSRYWDYPYINITQIRAKVVI